jgi:hypothetical protein
MRFLLWVIGGRCASLQRASFPLTAMVNIEPALSLRHCPHFKEKNLTLYAELGGWNGNYRG